MNKPKANIQSTNTKKEEPSLPPITSTALSSSAAATSQAQHNETTKTGKNPKRIMRFVVAIWSGIRIAFRFIDEHSPIVTTAATVVIGILTYYYVGYSKKQWQVAQDSLRISQGAYVSIGRKDGVVAEFVFPKDVATNAGIVMYFQNGGHLPAKFNWGLLAPITTIPQSPDLPALESVHKFNIMTRTTNRKDGSISENGGQVIAGDSLFVTDVIELPQERALRQMKANKIFQLWGAYEFCDALGNYARRQFMIFYQGEPFNRFSLSNDTDLNFGKPTSQDPNVEYLPPCSR